MKIICVGRNYANHAKELNNEIPTEPVLFLKPDSSLLRKNQAFYRPAFSDDIHYEAEIVLKINRLGKHIQPQFAHRYFNEITIGLDMTARDVQSKLKAKGLPWEKAKAFDHSAILGDFISIDDLDLTQLNFSLTKNGEKVQDGNTKDLLFSFYDLIAEISKYFTLKIGDLIFTGTPAGVGKVLENDILEGFIEDKKLLNVVVK